MMKKILLLSALFVLPLLAFSQSKDITIPWKTKQKSISAASNVAPISKGSRQINDFSHHGLQINEDNLLYQTLWLDTGLANAGSVKVTNVNYSSLTQEELSTINKTMVPAKLEYSIGSSRARDKIYTALSISPVIVSGGSYKKVTSFTVSYTYNQSRASVNRMPITNSVLANGNWYKFKVDETGVYRVTKDFLNSIGMNTDNIDPRNLKIYGHGGKPLPRFIGMAVDFDLPENSIKVLGEADGSFDSGDAILFYGIGTKGYDLENDTNLNPYSDEAFYYVTAAGGPGKRIQPMVQPTGAATTTITTFDDYKFHELDEVTPARVGRRWYGNRFDIENEQSFEFEFPNIVAQEPMQVVVKAAAASETSTSLEVSVNGISQATLQFRAIDGTTLLAENNFNAPVNAAGENVTIDLSYNNQGNPSSKGFLDYIGVTAVRNLSGAGTQLAFQKNETINMIGIAEYLVSNASEFSEIWDVTNSKAISSISNEASNNTIGFKANLGALRKYVALNPSNLFEPIEASSGAVLNQDLKGTILTDGAGNFQDIDYLIITPPFLLQPALRLANHHKNLSGMKVKVVTTDRIYEEFSSGQQDISGIRNFVSYVYQNASNPNNALRYLCLFGEASVDYKNRLKNNNNNVPTFHTLSSTNSATSFMSDDFYGSIGNDPSGGIEGTIGGTALDASGNRLPDIDRLDIAVGRIVADNVLLANTLVDKIIRYAAKSSYGNWRNNFILISDDVDEAFEYRDLELNLDNLGDMIAASKQFVNVKKIHSDAFLQETSAGGNRYPTVTKEIQNSTEVGALIINYFGHGGEDGLAKEFIYTKGVAENLRNPDNLPCIITVTCEFTKFDDPERITAGELTYWNPDGGAISLVTTTRSIFVSTGVEFNERLAPELFGFGTDNIPTPAEATRKAKNNIGSTNRRVVFFVGDPASHLAFPQRGIRITTLNGVPIGQSTDTLKALSRVRIGGEVADLNGNLLTNYNGVLEAKLFDKRVDRQTLANDGTRDDIRDLDGDGDTTNILILYYKALGEGLFNGQASVTNGKFEFEFVVPKDIQIPVGNARLSLYAQNSTGLQDNTGFNETLRVGSINEDAPEDNIGPTIRLFMNDESFVSGGITNDSPILLANLEDENGINTASGIGHDIIAILDGDESNPIVLNEFYQADVDDFTRGVTTYNLRDLEKGLHTLTLKAWDVYNNSSTADIQFIVAGNDELEITRVLNYPNPFVNYTEFWFNHNRPFESLEVQVQVFTVTGKVVWTKNQTITTDGFLSREIVWDGRDDFGDRIGKGVYVYKITVKSPLTNKQVEKFEKLVIL